MKVTAILPDEMVADVQKLSGGKNITDSLHKALTEWIMVNKLKELNKLLDKKPLEFNSGFSASKVRNLNRKST